MKDNRVWQIAIDGPGGAGKSTIAKAVAKKLNLLFINTGGMYRCYAIALKNIDLSNLSLVSKIMNENIVSLDEDRLFLNNKDVTDQCSNPEIAMLASTIGTIGIVREKCVQDQQKIASGHNCIMEGRDTTTVVLPNATLKIYLTASIDVRAERRWKQNNKTQDINWIKEDLKKRDYQDMNRKIAPLVKAPGAIEINTDNYSFDQNVQRVIDAFNQKLKELNNV